MQALYGDASDTGKLGKPSDRTDEAQVTVPHLLCLPQKYLKKVIARGGAPCNELREIVEDDISTLGEQNWTPLSSNSFWTGVWWQHNKGLDQQIVCWLWISHRPCIRMRRSWSGPTEKWTECWERGLSRQSNNKQEAAPRAT
mmetsp:Transcript_37471/g.79047  ORF Transcript_37471/g.79047 Transcript_37471/m.79047 type:complete len:142 (-) Transcript_37471:44-469(-)